MLPGLDREGRGEICSHGGRSPRLAVVVEEREAIDIDFVGIAKTTIFSHGGIGVVENGAPRSHRSRRQKMELDGKVGAGGGGLGIVGGGREKQAEGEGEGRCLKKIKIN